MRLTKLCRTFSDEPWPELLQALFQASKSPDASHREGAFRIFTTTPGIIEKQHSELVREVFSAGFHDHEQRVRIAAMEAFAAFFRSIKKSGQKLFYGLLGDIMNILVPLKDQQDTEGLSQALLALIELAEIAPIMFKPHFNDVVKFSISVVQDKDLGDQTRQNALEFLATFADTAPNMCRKDNSYTSDMVTQCLSLMTDIGMDDDDAAEWNDTDDVRARANSSFPRVWLADRDCSLMLMRAISTTLLVNNAWIASPTGWGDPLSSRLHSNGFLE